MNRRWKRPVLAALTIGLLLAYSGNVRAQNPAFTSYPQPNGGGNSQDPTPIAGTGVPEPLYSQNCPIKLPPSGPPDLTNSYSGAFDETQNYYSEPETYHYVTVDIMTLRTHYDRNPAFNSPQGIPGRSGPGDLDFDRGWQVVPRINMNFQIFEMWGIRGSWSRYFSNKSDVITILNPDPTRTISTPEPLPGFRIDSPSSAGISPAFPDRLTAVSELRMEVAKAEVTRYIEIWDWFGSLGLGLQYSYVSQNYSAQRTNPAFGGTRSIFYGHNFGGVGPEASINLALPLGERLRLYSNLSGAVMFADREEEAFANGPALAAATRREFTVLPMGEAEVGFSFQFGNNVVFPIAKVGIVGQYWVNAGNATNPNANLFLYGVNASVGFGF